MITLATPSRATTSPGVLLMTGIVLAALTEAISSTVLSLGRADILGDTYATPDEFASLDVSYTAAKLMSFLAAAWLMTRANPRNVLLVSVLVMGFACGLSGLATRLDLLTILRVVQGFAGGVLLVAGQAIIFLSYAPARQPVLQAIFAIGAVVAPATIAPALHGWLLDAQSWQWIFFCVVPIALFAAGLQLLAVTPAISMTVRRPFDWIGFLLISTTLSCFTFVVSQGSRWDWFEEPRILWLTSIGAAALIGYLGRRLMAKRNDFLDFSAFKSGDFTFAFIVSFVAGAALSGSAFLIQGFAISVLAFTPTDAGQLLLPSSVLFTGALLVAAFLFQTGRVPPIATVPFGILLIMVAMWILSGSTSESGADDMMPAVLLRGLGLGFLFLSITLIAFGNLSKQNVASGIGLFNTGRQLGSLMGVAGLQTLIDHHVAADLAILGASLTSGTQALGERLAATSAFLAAKGMEFTAASGAATSLLGRALTSQSTVIAFDTAFNAVALLFVVAVPALVAVKVAIARRTKARVARMSSAVSMVAPVIILAGCAVGPDYHPPETSVRDDWIAPVDVAEVDGEWWRKLNDATLHELVAAAIANNKDLEEAGARLREARANRDAIRGRALPQAGVSAFASENRLSTNGLLPVANIPGFDPQFPVHDIGFDASWEIDLWGSNRRAIESADARVQAVEETRRGVVIQIIAEVVRSYIDLRTAQNLRASVVADSDAQQEITRIVADRLRVGVASEFDLIRAQAQARSTAAAIPGLEADAAAAAIRLALLAGRHPEAFWDRLGSREPLPVADLHVSVGLRADLLRRRPDVRLAERVLAAATADVGVATADLFPRISLIGSVGQQARMSGDLFSHDSLRFQVGPLLRWPIYAGGRIRAQVRAANARAEGALIGYERAVAGALADSETAINRFAASIRARISRDDARLAADAAVSLARQRYVAGEDDMTALLQAQSAFTVADRLSIQARAAELQLLAALYKALGGGWMSAESTG